MIPGNASGQLFPEGYRASGILLHITSLPSRYGIGDFGPASISWVDRLAQAGQRWWQMLPLGPTGFGNSPYQALSSFALNGLLISPEWLIEDELLRASDIPAQSFPENQIDFDAVITHKHALLRKARSNFRAGARGDLRLAYEQFLQREAHWLEDYALFRALQLKFAAPNYLEWPAELVQRNARAMDRARGKLARQIDQICFEQYLAFRQADRLKAYARSRGVRLMGDLPFFVSPDSSDVWAQPELFLLDEERRPRVVAGVPPDYFAAEGQLWGNPVYDWDALRQGGYRWPIERLRELLTHVDAVRLDHFRAFAAAWHVQAGALTARLGEWIAGPGAGFLEAVRRELEALPFIAEDLGDITPDVYVLRDQFHLPGMRVLQFAFDGDPRNTHLPENYGPNTVAYTGTHDNSTARGWFEDLPESARQNVAAYLGLPAGGSGEAAQAMMRRVWSSAAVLAMAPLQDLLNLGTEARMNIPGYPDGNWSWRCTEAMFTDGAFDGLRELTKQSDRNRTSDANGSDKILEATSRN